MIISITKEIKTYYQSLINDTIKTIVNQFQRKPNNFLNEHDFHHYCYHAFYRKKEFSKQYVTGDGFRTNVLHPEYPTLKRFKRKTIALDPKGTRARYDMAILNPEFIEANKFKKVQCRDIGLFDIHKEYRSKNLMAALEFKFITRYSPKFIYEIQYDHFKLSKAEEVELKYMLIFTNIIEGEKKEGENYFKNLKGDKEIKITYVAVFKDGSRKKKRIRQYPYEWLDIEA